MSRKRNVRQFGHPWAKQACEGVRGAGGAARRGYVHVPWARPGPVVATATDACGDVTGRTRSLLLPPPFRSYSLDCTGAAIHTAL